MANYLKYGDIISFANGYGGKWGGGFLGTGGRSNISGALDSVGTFQSNSQPSTQWRILSFLNQKPLGQNIVGCDKIVLQNIADGGFLKLFNNNPQQNQNYDVATSELGSERAAAWHLLIRSNPNNDPNLVVEDQIYLLNSFNNGMGFLDTRGQGGGSGFLYAVSASLLFDREGSGTGAWLVSRG
ncbi:hypothetical protein G3O00_35720 [Burkholderia sp. Ac-20384]|uniref:hypothetical protein n=1 Tax=Burkholderia sp. Ac-20384 TaxID=2703902 RepID=UPI00197DF7A7|nr:hypothetical protein [Burkholderia sp. Ac-20384]MBN3828915.1 hypothetical protein [Burkholderia sp. Ac-20384]